MILFVPPVDWCDRGMGLCGNPRCHNENVIWYAGVPMCDDCWSLFNDGVRSARMNVPHEIVVQKKLLVKPLSTVD